jgi:hypothetical protein
MSESMVKKPMFQFDPSWLKALKTPVAIGLAVALVAQLLLALLLGGGTGMAPAATDVSLLTFDPDDVTALEITAAAQADGEEPRTLRLTRAGGGWTLPALGDFPASDTRVRQLLDSLAGLTRPLPVATTDDAQQRFKVADDAFERRVTLLGDDGELATLITGDSPGFRRLFARAAGEDAIYDLRLSLPELSADSDDWLDRGRLQLDREKVQRISGADWTLLRGEDGWQIEGIEQSPDADAVGDLLSSLTSLGYSGVLGTDAKPEYGLETPAATFEVGLEGGGSRHYRIGALADSDDYVLKLDDDPYFYRLAAFELDGLLELTSEKLLGNNASVPETDPAPGSKPDPASQPAPDDTAASRDEAASPPRPDPVTETPVESAVIDPDGESAADSAEAASSQDVSPPAPAGNGDDKTSASSPKEAK